MSRNIFILLYCAVVSTLTGCCYFSPTLQCTVKELGYEPVALPSKEFRPGNVVLATSRNPFNSSPVCDGTYIGTVTPKKDGAATVAATQKLTTSFNFDTDYFGQLGLDVDYHAIKDIKVSLSNVIVETVADDKVFSGLCKQEQGCTDAINSLQGNKAVGFLQKALIADATYSVIFDEGAKLSVETQNQIVRSLALKFGGAQSNVGDNTISGKGLYWGVQTRQDLVRTPASISTPCPPVNTIASVDTSSTSSNQNDYKTSEWPLIARTGNLATIKQIVEKGEKIDKTTPNGSTALHLAAKAGHIDVVQYLLEQKSNVNIQDEGGATPLFWASQGGSIDVVRALVLAESNLDSEAQIGSMLFGTIVTSPVGIASKEGYIEIVKYLVQRGSDLNPVEKRTGFLNTTVVKSPLELAIENTNCNIASYLLDNGAKPRKDTIFSAVNSCDADVFKKMLNKGANPDEIGFEGKTVRDIAIESNKLDIVALIDEWKRKP
ncbi:ankyrin repeat domain-containing protein [Geotalea uraniireducens]|nr:ankyrin repeat domain-containing protein [Geotalea uraniireducens]